MDELPEAAKRARLMELHIQASARPNCASVPYFPGEQLLYVAVIACCRLQCQARWFRVASRALSNTAVLRCRPCCSIWSSAAARCPARVPNLFAFQEEGDRRVAQHNKIDANLFPAGADTSAQYASQLPASTEGGAAGYALDQRNGDAGHAAAYEADTVYGGHTGTHPYGWPGYWAQAMHPYPYAYPTGGQEPAAVGHGAAPGPAEDFAGGCEPIAPGTEARNEAQQNSGGCAAAACSGLGSEPTPRADADGLGLLAGYESGSEGSGEHARDS